MDRTRARRLLTEGADRAARLKEDGSFANGRGWTDDMFMATAVLAHLFLGEHVTPQFIGGALVVIFGVVLAQLRAPRTAAEVPPEPA